MTEQEIRERCEEICKEAGYNFTIPVKLNKRLTRTLGRVIFTICHPSNRVSPTSMEFSYTFIQNATSENIDEVIKHECAHYLVILETKQNHGHDEVFKEMCSRINCSLDTACSSTPMIPSAQYKYTVFCSCCNQIVGNYSRAGKVIKNINNYKSSCCHAPLTLVQNW